MVQWIKDWAPILATIGTLLGVIITLGGANRTYRHGLMERRRDHQRELIGDLIATTQQWCGLLEVTYPAMAKMTTKDMMEFAGTDSARRQGELSTAVQVGLIKSLCEISDGRIRPLLADLELKRRTLPDGQEVAPLFSEDAAATQRFAALLVMLGRVHKIKAVCGQVQIAAIQALPVEIEHTSFGDRLRRWLSESMFVV